MFPSPTNSILHLFDTELHLSFCSLLFSSLELQTTFHSHDRLQEYYSRDQYLSTLNLLLFWKWINLIFNFLFLGFCSQTIPCFFQQKRDMFLHLLRNLFTHLLKIKINLCYFFYTALQFYIVLLTDSKILIDY